MGHIIAPPSCCVERHQNKSCIADDDSPISKNVVTALPVDLYHKVRKMQNLLSSVSLGIDCRKRTKFPKFITDYHEYQLNKQRCLK